MILKKMIVALKLILTVMDASIINMNLDVQPMNHRCQLDVFLFFPKDQVKTYFLQ